MLRSVATLVLCLLAVPTGTASANEPADPIRRVPANMSAFFASAYSAAAGRLFVSPGQSEPDGLGGYRASTAVKVFDTNGLLVGALPVPRPCAVTVTRDGRTVYVGGYLQTGEAIVLGFDARTLAPRSATIIPLPAQSAPCALTTVAGQVVVSLALNVPSPHFEVASINPLLPVAVPIPLPWSIVGAPQFAASADAAAIVAVSSSAQPTPTTAFHFNGVTWDLVATIPEDHHSGSPKGFALTADGGTLWMAGVGGWYDGDVSQATALLGYNLHDPVAPPRGFVTGYFANNLALDDAAGAITTVTSLPGNTSDQLTTYDLASGQVRTQVPLTVFLEGERALAVDLKRKTALGIMRTEIGTYDIAVIALP